MNFTARAATASDAEAIARIYNQGIEDRTSTFVTQASSADAIRGWFVDGTPIVVVESGGRVVGFASSSRWRASPWFEGIAELSVYVEREQRGRGVGGIALLALVRAARQSKLRKLIGGIFTDNRASRALFLRAGFRQVGVYEKQAQLDGVWKDVLLVERLLAPPDTVIFACVHNAGRSQMAAAFFNALARQPPDAQAISAGTQPAAQVHPEVVAAMGEVGIDLSAARPQLLTPELARGAALLITMGCGDACPVVPGLRRLDWPLSDPKGKSIEEVRRIRDEIKARVETLLADEGWS